MYTFQFCTIEVSQRPLRHPWLQVLGAFWVRNDASLENILLGWDVRRACMFFSSAPRVWSRLQAPSTSCASWVGMFVPQLTLQKIFAE